RPYESRERHGDEHRGGGSCPLPQHDQSDDKSRQPTPAISGARHGALRQPLVWRGKVKRQRRRENDRHSRYRQNHIVLPNAVFITAAITASIVVPWPWPSSTEYSAGNPVACRR